MQASINSLKYYFYIFQEYQNRDDITKVPGYVIVGFLNHLAIDLNLSIFLGQSGARVIQIRQADHPTPASPANGCPASRRVGSGCNA